MAYPYTGCSGELISTKARTPDPGAISAGIVRSEPIAWARIGEPVIGQEWTRNGYIAITERLSPADAVRKYGPITEVELGRNGGFRSVTYGTTKFFSRFVDPRGTGLYDDAVVVVDDPARANYECLVCLAPPGAQCVDKKGHPRGTHQKRSQGRSSWEIERAQEADRIAREKAQATEQLKREMAKPPATGTVIEIKRWKPAELGTWKQVPDAPDRITVERTYANRTVEGATECGARMFLARNEFTGEWYEICGQPTSTRLPCRNGGTGVPCRTRHNPGRQLCDDSPWDLSADST